MLELYLARHGETEENVAQILQGHLPGRLTAAGRAQAAALREQLVAEGALFRALVCSDLARAAQTADILNEAFRLEVLPCPLLRERDWGQLTGVKIAEARLDPLPADVESVEAMYARARRFLGFLLARFGEGRVLAVGHGLFNRCVLAVLAGCTLREVPRMHNAEVRRVSFDRMPGETADGGDMVSAD